MKSFKSILRKLLMGNKAIIIVLVLGTALALASPVFMTSKNMMNVFKQVCVSAILACGFCMCLGSGNMDLSIGSQVGLLGYVVVRMIMWGAPIWLAILVGIVCAVCIGAIIATVITVFQLPAFIVTLAMQQILRGALYVVTGMVPLTNVPDSYKFIGQGYILGIPFQLYIMLFAVGFVWFLINRTRYGRHLLAMGGNWEAARVSGINTTKMTYCVYISVSLFALLAGIVLSSRSGSAQPTAGLNMEMDAIAAVVVGGTMMSGGVVNVLGAFFGSMIVGIVNNGMNLLGISSNWQLVTKGALILFAIVLDRISASVLSSSEKAESMNALKNSQKEAKDSE